MHQVQKLLIALALALGLYFSLTWFFFGSSHPCGILEARQNPYVLERVKRYRSEDLKLALELAQSPLGEAVEAGTQMLEDIRRGPREALSNLHEKVWGLTPAQCLWRAISWDPNPSK